MNNGITYQWDSEKAAETVMARGIPFSAVLGFDWNTATVKVDDRKNYGEKRFNALGMIGNQLHAMTFTNRGNDVRIISLRRASRKERKEYGTQ